MNHSTRTLRRTLCAVATDNEAAALEVMRALDQLNDRLLRQRLLTVVYRLNKGALELRAAKDTVPGDSIKRA
ncbi:MAG: hypothetical protein ABWY06_23305 [Pseudomonas sp.]|uniref:hypothetical protein n=1 Tax=Pseudomonas sp. TaxID=306 RepID=UPI003396CD54